MHGIRAFVRVLGYHVSSAVYNIRIITLSTQHRIDTCAAIQRVIASVTINYIVAAQTGETVITGRACEHISTIGAGSDEVRRDSRLIQHGIVRKDNLPNTSMLPGVPIHEIHIFYRQLVGAVGTTQDEIVAYMHRNNRRNRKSRPQPHNTGRRIGTVIQIDDRIEPATNIE